MKIVELFSGTECISNTFREHGHECFTVDWDEQFPSSWHTDISKITANDIVERFGVPDVIWIGTDCTTYSVAAISRHRKKNPETGNLDPISEYAKFCDAMNIHVREVVDELLKLNPNLVYWWENPRAAFRKMKFMEGIPRYTVTYCQYMQNDPWEKRRMKPTDLFTNVPNPGLRPPCKNGDNCHPPAPRGTNKYGSQALKTAKERAMYPKELCEHIVQICEEFYKSTEN